MFTINRSARANNQIAPRLGGPGTPKYHSGKEKSVRRLENLKYDPIGELVAKYRELDEELLRQKKIRNNEIVELNNAGRPRAFNPETMMAIYDKQIAIAEKLLRYRYGRVPEVGDAVTPPIAPLVVNLTKKGETYVVNEQPEVIENDDEDSDAFEQQRSN